MIYIQLNAIAILVATFAGLVAGLAVRRQRRSIGFYLLAFVLQAWFAAILAGALILAPPKAAPWIMATGSAFVIWIGFVVPATIVTLRQRGISAAVIATDCLYWLVVMVAQAVVLQAIGLVPPPA